MNFRNRVKLKQLQTDLNQSLISKLRIHSKFLSIFQGQLIQK